MTKDFCLSNITMVNLLKRGQKQTNKKEKEETKEEKGNGAKED